jgi:deoxycytidine triphosphate deaminase
MLNRMEIEQLELIHEAVEANYRFSTYDVSISHIITSDGLPVETYKLPPMGIIEVISAERLWLPADICAVAHVKTGLCNEGLLTLNTGIVDPGWRGRVSSYILNFSKNDHLLLAGEVFLRITFHKLNASDPRNFTDVNDAQYVADRRKRIVETFSPYFLDLPKIIEKSVDANLGKFRDAAVKYIPAFAAGLAVLTFLLNFATLTLVQRWLQPNDAAKAELYRSALEQQDSKLLHRIEVLERQTKSNDESRTRGVSAPDAQPSQPPAPTPAVPSVQPRVEPPAKTTPDQ